MNGSGAPRAAVPWWVVLRSPGVRVLTYHAVDRDVGDRWRSFAVTPRAFARQMDLLARLGWRCLPLDRVLEDLARGIDAPPRAFALTFDDGYDDLDHDVAPVLARHGFVATVFVVAGRLGGTTDWSAAGGEPERRLLPAEALRRLDGRVFRFESHSLTHPVLTRLAPADAREEISGSRRALEDVLGRPVRAFAYPHGAFDDATEARVRDAGYAAVATTVPGPNPPGTSAFRLRRVTLRAHDTPATFLFKVVSGHGLRSAMRRALGRDGGGARS